MKKNPMLAYLDLEIELGWHHFAISNIIEEYNKKYPKNHIDAAIDKATGYGNIRDLETTKLLLGHLTRLVRKHKKMKDFFGREYSSDNCNKLIKELRIVQKSINHSVNSTAVK